MSDSALGRVGATVIVAHRYVNVAPVTAIVTAVGPTWAVATPRGEVVSQRLRWVYDKRTGVGKRRDNGMRAQFIVRTIEQHDSHRQRRAIEARLQALTRGPGWEHRLSSATIERVLDELDKERA